MSVLTRSKQTAPDLSDDEARWLPAGYSDERSEFYVEPELRALYAAEAGDMRKQRAALDNAQWGLGGPGSYATTTDDKGRTVTAAPKSLTARVHDIHLATARLRHAEQVKSADIARRRREHAEDTSRCALCGEHGLDPNPGTGHFLVTGMGALTPSYGVGGSAVRLHAGCAAALNVAARDRVPAELVDAARGFLANLDD